MMSSILNHIKKYYNGFASRFEKEDEDNLMLLQNQIVRKIHKRKTSKSVP